ncbi:MAG: hypothetical protein HZY76_18710 [Anaerolineae bacterium]|nr:MAG: hypothetical protein HZY76_18710 [Anaerolineae bacterium]
MEGIVKKFVPALLVAIFVLAACAQALRRSPWPPAPPCRPSPPRLTPPRHPPWRPPKPHARANGDPTPEGTPTATPTNTPGAQPVAVVRSQTANVRSTAYGIVGRVSSGQRYDIVGKNADGSWWQICCVGGQQGWITGDLVAAEGDTGSVAVVGDVQPHRYGQRPHHAPSPPPPAHRCSQRPRHGRRSPSPSCADRNMRAERGHDLFQWLRSLPQQHAAQRGVRAHRLLRAAPDQVLGLRWCR